MKKIALLMLLCALCSVIWAQKSPRHVVMLSLDAFRHDYPSAVATPTLDSLARVGSSAVTRPPFPANTFPSHYAIATGMHPGNNGMINNKFRDKRLGIDFSIGGGAETRDSTLWGGEPLWSMVERKGLKSAVCMWVGSDVDRHFNPRDMVHYNKDMSFKERADWVLGQLMKPADSIPNLIMWYIQEPDGISHNVGPFGKPALDMVSSLDSLLSYFFNEARKSPDFDNIDFIVTADHGMAQITKDRYINLWPLLDREQVEYCFDGSPTLLEVKPSYRAEAERILRGVANVRLFVDGKLPAEYHFGSNGDRVPTFVLLPDTGYRLDYREYNRPFRGGSHGFDPFDNQMKTIFFASGPDFKQGFKAPEFCNVNIYALISHLLGIEPPHNDGSLDNVRTMLRVQ